jgi:UDP-N-acetylmuramoyl-tripeptide--D-alanyl-D-alanine ligase
MRFRASDVAAATEGVLIGPDVALDGVSFDSRTLRAGQLFVPIVADRDGHDFVAAAVANGAAAYLSARGEIVGEAATRIVVGDTLQALMDLARGRRQAFGGTVVGITGSVGKTSTKDLAWAALAASGKRTWANESSFNNDQGLPTTILNAPDDTETLVLEMGMRGLGEIARLCHIAAPQIGIVTRVAEAHSDRVGGIDGVATAKGELPAALPSHGCAILNGDDARVAAMASITAAAVVRFGEARSCEARISDVRLDDLARATFQLDSPWGAVEVALGVSGRHMVHNAAAALACVGVVGGDLAAGAAALRDVTLTAMRMQIGRTATGALLLDDSYNANPTSMRAAIDALVDLPATRRIAVLGAMAEIADAPAEHVAIARYAAERGVRVIAVSTPLYGLPPVTGDDPASLVAATVDAVGSIAGDDAVLVKASRAAGLDRIAKALRDDGV